MMTDFAIVGNSGYLLLPTQDSSCEPAFGRPLSWCQICLRRRKLYRDARTLPGQCPLCSAAV